ncbi:MAG: hypothetical protein Kow006_12320 [Gammaproteobacteria bacterium]
MKRALIYLVIGVVAYAGFLLYKLPAAVAYSHAAGELQPLSATGIEGTVWAGRAAQVSFQRRPVGSVTWRLNPLPLVLGNVAATVEVKSPAGALAARVIRSSDGTVRLEEVTGEADVASLAPWVGLQTFHPEGRLNIDLAQLELQGRRPIAATGELVWRDASLRAPSRVALGELGAVLSTTPQGVRAVLRDSKSPFALDAAVQFQANGSYRLNGKISARANADPAVHQLMESLGVRNRGAALPISFSGRL